MGAGPNRILIEWAKSLSLNLFTAGGDTQSILDMVVDHRERPIGASREVGRVVVDGGEVGGEGSTRTTHGLYPRTDP